MAKGYDPEPESCPIALTEPTVIDSSGLLGHLMDHLAGSLRPPERARAESVLFDLVRPMAVAELRLPAAHDQRVREIAAALAHDPSDQRTLAAWGRSAGAEVGYATPSAFVAAFKRVVGTTPGHYYV